MQYADKDLTFYLVVYRDYEQADWCLTRVRETYPGARIVVEVDGDDDPRWALLRQRHAAEVHYGERLFLVPCGGRLLLRMLHRHMDDPQQRRWLLAIDTDTMIRRRFRFMPESWYFGMCADKANHYFIQGGFVGLARGLCKALLDSCVLENPRLGEDTMLWRRWDYIARERVEDHGLISSDWMLNWACAEIGVRGRPFLEVISHWRQEVPMDVDCAVSHPHKIAPVDRPI